MDNDDDTRRRVVGVVVRARDRVATASKDVQRAGAHNIIILS